MEYPENIYMSPRKAILRFMELMRTNPQEGAKSNSFKPERELLAVALAIIGIGQLRKEHYFIRPGENISPDIDARAVTFRNNDWVYSDIQVTEFESHNPDIVAVIRKKIERTFTQGDLELVVNVREKGGQTFDPSDIAARVKRLNPGFRTICFVVDSAKDEWLYHVRFVWPHVWGCDFQLEKLLPTIQGKDWLRLTRGLRSSVLEYNGETYDLPVQ